MARDVQNLVHVLIMGTSHPKKTWSRLQNLGALAKLPIRVICVCIRVGTKVRQGQSLLSFSFGFGSFGPSSQGRELYASAEVHK